MLTTDQEQLTALAARIEQQLNNGPAPGDAIDRLRRAASQVGATWSGSSYGYHANVYYRNLEAPPPGAHFSSEWGLIDSFAPGTTGDWVEFSREEVFERISQITEGADSAAGLKWAKECESILLQGTNLLRSIASTSTARRADGYLDDLIVQVDGLKILTVSGGQRAQLPSKLMTRDATAISQGLRLAPHQEVVAEVVHVDSAFSKLRDLGNICQYIQDHIRITSAA